MSLSPDSSLVRRTIDLNYANKQRSVALKWIFINGMVFLLLMYDLCYKCPGYTSALHYVEMCFAAALCVSMATHAWRLRPSHMPPRSLSPRQLRLLGLRREDLDSSFELSPDRIEQSRTYSDSEPEAATNWSGSPSSTGASPPPAPAPSPPASPRSPPDEFIADRRQLEDYLRNQPRHEAVECSDIGSNSSVQHWQHYSVLPAPSADLYQLATVNTEKVSSEEHGEAAAAHVWRGLQVDPTQLTQFNLNLRRWLHATILERVVREMDRVDELLERAGHEARISEAAPARLRALAAASPASPIAGRVRALLPFLRDHPDRRYLVKRIRELARGGCLSAYRWDGGGADWRPPRPTDAELVLELFEAYVASVSGGGTPAARIIRASQTHPPHYLLRLERDTLDVGRGRNNLFHTMLLLIAAAARSDPPALCRLHLGRAGLNMLWIIGR